MEKYRKCYDLGVALNEFKKNIGSNITVKYARIGNCLIELDEEDMKSPYIYLVEVDLPPPLANIAGTAIISNNEVYDVFMDNVEHYGKVSQIWILTYGRTWKEIKVSTNIQELLPARTPM